jgi:MoaA/NifB/PqqE/SkfB family radical SAM enzyme
MNGTLFPAHATPPPVKLIVEMTSACNLRCPHCYVSAGEGRFEQVPPPLLHGLLEEFAEMGGQSVTLSGGEPTVHPGWQPALRYARYVGLDACLLTNATRLDSRNLDLLTELGTRVAISLDGASPAVHDAIRGAGMYARTMSAIRDLIARGGGPKVTICFTPMATTFRELSGIVSLATDLGVETIYVSLLEDRGRASGDLERLGLNDAERAELIFTVFSLQQRYPDLFLDCPNLALFPERLTGEDLRAEELDRTIRVTAAGDVYLSAYVDDTRFRLGSYGPGSLSTMWHDGRVARHLSDAAARTALLVGCQACPGWDYCLGGSAVLALAEHGSFLAVDEFCSAKRRIVAELLSA